MTRATPQERISWHLALMIRMSIPQGKGPEKPVPCPKPFPSKRERECKPAQGDR